jgi:hypothetical protein
VDSLGSIRKNREKSMVAKCQICVWASNYFSSDSARAFYNSSTKTAHIASNAEMRTALHEAVHALEFDHPDILKKTTAFLKKRAGKDGLTKYNGELGYSDKWAERGGNQYTGRNYTSKVWPKVGEAPATSGPTIKTYATEILTMGVERWLGKFEQFRAFS